MTTRTQLLHAAKAALLAPEPQTDAGREVHIGRLTPVFEARMPVILIYSPQRRAEPELSDTSGPRRWTATLSIEAGAAGPQAEETAEIVAGQVAAIFDRDPTLGGLVESLRLTEVETDADGAGATPMAGARLTYEAVYREGGDQADWAQTPTAVVIDPDADAPDGEAPDSVGLAPLARDYLDNGLQPTHARRTALEARLIDRNAYLPGVALDDIPALAVADAAGRDALLLVRETRILTLPAIHRDRVRRPGRSGVFLGHAPEIGPEHEADYREIDRWIAGE